MESTKITYSEFWAGCVGGAAGVCVGHPLDTTKVRLQILAAQRQKTYTGTFDCLLKTCRHESVFGLYKGLASPIGGVAFINAIIFGVQANSLQLMRDPNSLQAHFIAGGLAGFAQSFICSPIELSKIRIQMAGLGKSHTDYKINRTYTGSLDCLLQVFKRYGFAAVYKGFNMTLLREVPAFATYFLTYEYLSRELQKLNPDGDIGIGGYLLAGGVAGVNSWIVCYPQDVIKSRLQADKFHSPRYKNALDCLRKSYRAEGMTMFMNGFSSALMRAFPVNAATFATFSVMMNWIRQFDSNAIMEDVFINASAVLASEIIDES